MNNLFYYLSLLRSVFANYYEIYIRRMGRFLNEKCIHFQIFLLTDALQFCYISRSVISRARTSVRLISDVERRKKIIAKIYFEIES